MTIMLSSWLEAIRSGLIVTHSTNKDSASKTSMIWETWISPAYMKEHIASIGVS
jgi:hypothetical protein